MGVKKKSNLKLQLFEIVNEVAGFRMAQNEMVLGRLSIDGTISKGILDGRRIEEDVCSHAADKGAAIGSSCASKEPEPPELFSPAP